MERLLLAFRIVLKAGHRAARAAAPGALPI